MSWTSLEPSKTHSIKQHLAQDRRTIWLRIHRHVNQLPCGVFTNQYVRNASSTPGPLEARRRLAGRHLNNLATHSKPRPDLSFDTTVNWDRSFRPAQPKWSWEAPVKPGSSSWAGAFFPSWLSKPLAFPYLNSNDLVRQTFSAQPMPQHSDEFPLPMPNTASRTFPRISLPPREVLPEKLFSVGDETKQMSPAVVPQTSKPSNESSSSLGVATAYKSTGGHNHKTLDESEYANGNGAGLYESAFKHALRNPTRIETGRKDRSTVILSSPVSNSQEIPASHAQTPSNYLKDELSGGHHNNLLLKPTATLPMSADIPPFDGSKAKAADGDTSTLEQCWRDLTSITEHKSLLPQIRAAEVLKTVFRRLNIIPWSNISTHLACSAIALGLTNGVWSIKTMSLDDTQSLVLQSFERSILFASESDALEREKLFVSLSTLFQQLSQGDLEALVDVVSAKLIKSYCSNRDKSRLSVIKLWLFALGRCKSLHSSADWQPQTSIYEQLLSVARPADIFPIFFKTPPLEFCQLILKYWVLPRWHREMLQHPASQVPLAGDDESCEHEQTFKALSDRLLLIMRLLESQDSVAVTNSFSSYDSLYQKLAEDHESDLFIGHLTVKKDSQARGDFPSLLASTQAIESLDRASSSPLSTTPSPKRVSLAHDNSQVPADQDTSSPEPHPHESVETLSISRTYDRLAPIVFPFVAFLRTLQDHGMPMNLIQETLEEILIMLHRLHRPHYINEIIRGIQNFLHIKPSKGMDSFADSLVSRNAQSHPSLVFRFMQLYPSFQASHSQGLIENLIAGPKSKLHPQKIMDIIFRERMAEVPRVSIDVSGEEHKHCRLSLSQVSQAHKAAISFSRASRFSTRASWTNVWRLWKYLRLSNAPIDARMSRAMVTAGILRPILENECWKIPQFKYSFILTLVKALEGEEVASAVDRMVLKAQREEGRRIAREQRAAIFNDIKAAGRGVVEPSAQSETALERLVSWRRRQLARKWEWSKFRQDASDQFKSVDHRM